MAASNPCCLPPYIFIPTISKWSVGVGGGGILGSLCLSVRAMARRCLLYPLSLFVTGLSVYVGAWSWAGVSCEKKKKKITRLLLSCGLTSTETSYGLLGTWGGVCVWGMGGGGGYLGNARAKCFSTIKRKTATTRTIDIKVVGTQPAAQEQLVYVATCCFFNRCRERSGKDNVHKNDCWEQLKYDPPTHFCVSSGPPPGPHSFWSLNSMCICMTNYKKN